LPYCPIAEQMDEPELRACASDSDCVLHDRSDCCGDHYIVGLVKTARCVDPSSNPDCVGCSLTPWYRTDDGRVETREDGIVARCIDKKCESANPWCNGVACPGDHICVAGCVLNSSCQPLPGACSGKLNVRCADALCDDDVGGMGSRVVTPHDVYCQNVACMHGR
jgi:hypothetical protein